MPREARKKVRLNASDKAVTISPFEGEMDLDCFVEFQLRGRTFGAALLNMGRQYKLVFGFECHGIHPELPEEQMQAIQDKLTAGMSQIPEGEQLTMQMSSFASDGDRLQDLKTLHDQTDNPLLRYVLASEELRTQQLIEGGLRKPKRLRLYVSCTSDPDQDVKGDWVASFLKGTQRQLNKITGAWEFGAKQEFLDFVDKGESLFFEWEQILINKMGLSVTSCTAQALWGNLWSRFNDFDSTCPELPQLLVVDDEGINERFSSHLSARSVLLGSESSVPKCDIDHVSLCNKHIGVLSSLSTPDEWESPRAAINDVWGKLGHDQVRDTEVFAQFSKPDQTKSRQNIKNLAEEAMASSAKSAEEAEANFGSSVKYRQAEQAGIFLAEGGVSINCSVAWLVYRDTLAELDRDCAFLSSLFLYPHTLHREMLYSWQSWLQTIPLISFMPMFSRPFDRRFQAPASAFIGLSPIGLVCDTDKAGFELLTAAGGVPIHIDLVDRHHHIQIIATTRAGKSAMIVGLLNYFYAQGVAITIMDCPPSAEAASFRDWCSLMGGAYADMGSKRLNPFEVPELGHLPPDIINQRDQIFRDYLLDILLLMAKPRDTEAARKILILIINEFFKSQTICRRIQEARKGGLGSEAWDKYPCLADFIYFCRPALVNTNGQADTDLINEIVIGLRSYSKTRTGAFLSGPSTIKASDPLFVMTIMGLGESDMEIMSMISYGVALRRAFESKVSIFVVDEAAELLKSPSFANSVGKMTAIGAKAGIRVILLSQGVEGIAGCAAGEQIRSNIDLSLIGRLQPGALDSCCSYLQLPREMLQANITGAFMPNKSLGYSSWIYCNGDTSVAVRAYLSPGTLAVIANNKNEITAREEHFANNPDNPILAIHNFSQEYASGKAFC